MRPINRRRAMALMASAAAGTAVSGCAEKWGFSGGDDGKVHLTYALWDAYQQVGYQQSIDEFQKLHPDIHVTIEQIPYNSFQPKITAEFISDNAPDVFWINTPFIGSYIDSGMVADISDRVRADNIDLDPYYPALVELHKRGDALYGLPKDWDTIALYYNKDHFKKQGVEPTDDLTWQPDGGGSFLPFLQQLTVDGKGRNAADPAFDPGDVATYAIGIGNDPQSGYGSYLAMNGGSILPEPYATSSSIDSPENAEALQFVTRVLRDAHVAAPGGEVGPNADGSNLLSLFSQGRIAIYQAGDWVTSSLAGQTEFPIGVLPLPAGPKGRVSVFNGLCDGLNAHTSHPDEAWELVKWLGTARSQEIMGSGGYVWPGIERLDPLFLKAWQKKGIDLTAFLTEARGETVNFPVGVGVGEMLQDVGTELGPVFLGTKSIEQGLADAAEVADHRLSTAE